MSDPFITTALGGVKAAADVVSVFKDAVEAVQNLPKENAVNLALALDEVHKELQVLLQAIADYRRLALVRDFEETAASVLAGLEGSALRVRIQHAGGSCHIIRNIYQDHLESWWFRKLRPTLYQQTTQSFERLGEADGVLFAQMEQVSGFLSREARDVLDLVLEAKWPEARDRVRTGRSALLELEQDMESVMLALLEVRDSALRRAGVTTFKPSAA